MSAQIYNKRSKTKLQELLRLTNKVLLVKAGKAVRDSVRENFRKGGVTAKMKGFFWAQHYKARGDAKELSTEAQFWRNMALKKVGSQIKIVQRQYVLRKICKLWVVLNWWYL